jgi:hypothetical protein
MLAVVVAVQVPQELLVGRAVLAAEETVVKVERHQ